MSYNISDKVVHCGHCLCHKVVYAARRARWPKTWRSHNAGKRLCVRSPGLLRPNRSTSPAPSRRTDGSKERNNRIRRGRVEYCSSGAVRGLNTDITITGYCPGPDRRWPWRVVGGHVRAYGIGGVLDVGPTVRRHSSRRRWPWVICRGGNNNA